MLPTPAEKLQNFFGVFLQFHIGVDIEEAEREAEAIKDVIKAVMGPSEELRAGEYKITRKAVTASRLDSKALKAALPEVVERFTRATTTRRFCVV